MQHEGLVVLDLDYIGEVAHVFANVDKRAARVAEDKEQSVEVDIDARRLDAAFAQRLDDDTPRIELLFD